MSTKYSIGEFSKKTGLTIRTLHYYDEIGILKPTLVTEKGRRYYSERDLVTLQKIVTLKFLGYSLEQIKDVLQEQSWNLQDSLRLQRKMMEEQKAQIENVLKALDHAIDVADHHGEVDASIFMTLINGIQMENEHKAFLKGFMDEERVEQIYNRSDERQKEIDKEMVGILSTLNHFYETDRDHIEVQKGINRIVDILLEVTGGDFSFLENMDNIEVENEDWLFPSPFTKEVEEWMLQQILHNLKDRGIQIDGTGKE